jgi:aryl-alcohol dehydrogenase-like predicted oxidoreductase
MMYRTLGRTGWDISTVSFGAWAIGGSWGAVDEREAMQALHRAVDRGINLFDTADELAPLSPEVMAAVREIYDTRIKPRVHAYW